MVLLQFHRYLLGLVVTPDYNLPMAAQFLANIGPFSKGIQTGPDDRKRISLWEIYSFQGDAKRQPTVADLEYVAGLIESEYRL